jgi:hypothetical protein
MKEPIYCTKCKKKTDNFNANTVKTFNKRWRVSAQYLKCKTKKSQFKAAPQAEEDRLVLAKELHKPARIHFIKRRIITKGIDDLWTADLMDMKQYSGENGEYAYLLNVIYIYFLNLFGCYRLKTKVVLLLQ